MPYNEAHDPALNPVSRRVGLVPSDPRDLEAIVLLLEVSAISLTPAPGTVFTREQLFAEAHKFWGSKPDLDDRDLAQVLSGMKTIARSGRYLTLAGGVESER